MAALDVDYADVKNFEESTRWFLKAAEKGSDRFCWEAYYWLTVSMSAPLPQELLLLVEGKRKSLEE